MSVYSIFFEDGLAQPESSRALYVAKLGNWDPNGLWPSAGGLLNAGHDAGSGALAGAVV